MGSEAGRGVRPTVQSVWDDSQATAELSAKHRDRRALLQRVLAGFAERAARLRAFVLPKASDEKLVAGNHSGDTGEPGASARARRESLLQLAPADTGAIRGPRSRALEADQRQPTPRAPLPQSRDLRAMRPG